MALGAGRRHVLWLAVRGTAGVVAIGTAIGLAAAVTASDLITTMLFQLRTTDARVYASATACLVLVGLAACIPPVLRALRIQPETALRYE